MAFTFIFAVDGVVQMARSIERFAGDVKDVRPAWPGVLQILRLASAERFRTAGAHGGQRWVPLSPRYAAYKARRWPGRGILVRTGALQDSLTQETGQSIVQMHPLELRYGTKVPYAVFHQRGGRRLPRREVIHLAESDKLDVMREVQRYLVKRAKSAGLKVA